MSLKDIFKDRFESKFSVFSHFCGGDRFITTEEPKHLPEPVIELN